MICFHHDDLDGRMSGAIIKFRYPECKMYEINYGDDFPWDLVDPKGYVFMVDFTLESFVDMLKLATRNLIWIDHHKTAIDAWREHGSPPIVGTRAVGVAACVLTWRYIFPDKPVPHSVTLAGKYDVWDHTSPEVLHFQYGMMIEDCRPENQTMWKWLFEDISTSVYSTNGYTIKKYIDQTNAEICKAQTFETSFRNYRAADYRCLAVNRLFVSSYFFDSVKNLDGYDVLIMFGWQNGKWKVSLRSNREGIDVATIAEVWNGGGHSGAAGFSCDVLPFDLTNLNAET